MPLRAPAFNRFHGFSQNYSATENTQNQNYKYHFLPSPFMENNILEAKLLAALTALQSETKGIMLDSFEDVQLAYSAILNTVRNKGPPAAPIRYLSGSFYEAFGTPRTFTSLSERLSTLDKINMLIWTDAGIISSSAAELVQKHPTTLDLRLSATSEFSDRVPHFVVVDNNSFVLETPHHSFNERPQSDDSVRGVMCHNYAQLGIDLATTFDRLFAAAYSQRITLR